MAQILFRNGKRFDDPNIIILKSEIDYKYYYAVYDKEYRLIQLPTRYGIYLTNSPAYSDKSVPEYIKVIRHFLLYLLYNERLNGLSFDDAITKAGSFQVENFLSSLQVSPNSRRTYDAMLRSFYQWLNSSESGNIISINQSPYSNGKFKTKKPHKVLVKYLTVEELVHFINSGFEDEFDRCMLHFFFETGIRSAELQTVLLSDFPDLTNFDRSQAYFPLVIRGVKGAGNDPKLRRTIVSSNFLDRLCRLVKYYPPVVKRIKYNGGKLNFPVFLSNTGQVVNHKNLTKKIWRICKKLVAQGLLKNSISLHILRHGFAISILNSELGSDMAARFIILKNLMGHNQLETTSQYTEMPAEILEQCRAKMAGEKILFRYQETQFIYNQTIQLYQDEKIG